ncbi:hypothetical protein JCM5350_003583 [Sporobolomyces pararoseus]
MEHAPFSPVASTSRRPYQPDSPFVQTSDFGEFEEEQALSGGEEYWTKRGIARKDKKVSVKPVQLVEPLTSDDELAMSPIRPRPSSEDDLVPPSQLFSKVKSKRPRSPSPTSAAPTLSSRTSPARLVQTSVSTSPLPLTSTLARRKKRRSVTPVESDDSSGTLKAITRPKPIRQLSVSSAASSEERNESSHPRRSPEPPRISPSPRLPSSPAEDFPVLPPSPPAGRSFRTRTAAQLKPFSTEQFRYTKTLLKNGWEGAVVAGPKAVELSAEEIRRKKLEQATKKKDDLGGWLVEEEEGEGSSARAARLAKESQPSTGFSLDDDESEDGLTLLEREARRKERMRKETEAGLGSKRTKTARTKNTSPHRKGPSRIDSHDYSATKHPYAKGLPRKSRPNRPRAESEPPSSSPGTASRHYKSRNSSMVKSQKSRHESSKDGKQPRKHRKTASTRADSEPPASSPARPKSFVSKSFNRRMAKPSKPMHAREGRNDRNALDADILNLPQISSASESSDVEIQDLDGESEIPDDSQDEEEEEEASEADEEESSKARRSRLRLDSKRQRALGAMLPAVFFKKAKADLKLMEQERDMGFSSGSEINSGDEEAEVARRNKAKIRTDSKMLDEPMRLDGDAFTDESGEEPERTDSEAEQEEQEENDAVSAWMRNFAPKRSRGGQDEEADIVDRFLKRARRPTKAGGGGKRKTVKKNGKRVSKGKSKEKGKDRSERRDQLEGQDARGRYSRSGAQAAASAKTSRQPRKAVQLDTDRSIFVFAGLRNELDEDDEIVITTGSRKLPPPQAPVRPPNPQISPLLAAAQGAQVEENSEIWATFGKFTPDFGIDRLPSGVQFASTDSFVRNGHLYSLLHPTSANLLSCYVYGSTLDSTATPEIVESLLPTITDSIYDSISHPDQSIADASLALRYLGTFIATTLAKSSSDVKYRFGSMLATQIDHLQVRIDNLKVEGSHSGVFNKARIALSWYFVDLTVRLGSISAVGGDSRRLARQVTNLVRLLLQHGIDRSLASLKRVMQDTTSSQLLVSDITVEAWLGLVSLATREGGGGDATFDQSDLWTVVSEETMSQLPEHTGEGGPIAGEILSLSAMFLCAVSQFSPSGISTATPRLDAHWQVMLRSLDPIKASALSEPEHSVSSTAITRRDRYLSNLFARCLVLVERWGWKLDVKDDLLGRLFDLLAARRLANLSTEAVTDFPLQLVDLKKFGVVALESSKDTTFSIFLKLVTSAVNNLPAGTDAERRRRSIQLTRLAVRLVPMTTVWNRQSPELTKSDSILVNHYSLLLTLAILHPAQAVQRVEQASKLINFGDTEEEARKATVRAIRYWALAFRHFNLPLLPLLDWLAKIVVQLKTEYIGVETQKRIERTDKPKGDQLWPRALLITMSLRLVQDVMRWKNPDSTEDNTFPDAALLNPAWTSDLLSSALALDPMIGREVLKTIDCYLDLRSISLEAIVPAPPPTDPSSAQQDSQDDYGMGEFDFEDPALDALLGGGEAVPGVTSDLVTSESQVRLESDKLLAQTVMKTLVPSFFNLINLIYGNSIGAGPKIGDRSSYTNDVVDSWTRCIAILVSHGLDSWQLYLKYGNHSFNRLADALAKLDTSLFQAVYILRHEPSVYSACNEEILTIWFTTIVSSKLTSQHLLTESLLNHDVASPLFANVPFVRSSTSRRFEVEQLELLDKRVDFLRASVVFSNAAQIANFQPSAAAPFAQPPIQKIVILRFLRAMLSAIKTFFSSIRDEPSKRSYARLVKEILGALNSSAASTVNGTRASFGDAISNEVAALQAQISSYV